MALSDLPDVVPFLRHNAARNKAPMGPVPPSTAMAVVPLHWGVPEDIAALPAVLRALTLVLGADLIYTEKADVRAALSGSDT